MPDNLSIELLSHSNIETAIARKERSNLQHGQDWFARVLQVRQ